MELDPRTSSDYDLFNDEPLYFYNPTNFRITREIRNGVINNNSSRIGDIIPVDQRQNTNLYQPDPDLNFPQGQGGKSHRKSHRKKIHRKIHRKTHRKIHRKSNRKTHRKSHKKSHRK